MLKTRNADCFSYLLGNYYGRNTIMMCWLGETYSQPVLRLLLKLSS